MILGEVFMEKIVCYTSSSSEKGKKVYGRGHDLVEYTYKPASDLYFLIIEDKKVCERVLVLLEKQDENLFSSKYGYVMDAYLTTSDVNNDIFETKDATINIIESFPFEDIDDISCGRHYKDDEVKVIYNVMNSWIMNNYSEKELPVAKGMVLFKSKNN